MSRKKNSNISVHCDATELKPILKQIETYCIKKHFICSIYGGKHFAGIDAFNIFVSPLNNDNNSVIIELSRAVVGPVVNKKILQRIKEELDKNKENYVPRNNSNKKDILVRKEN